MGLLDAPSNPNALAALTDISALGLVPCITRGRSFLENAGTALSDGTQTQVTYFTAYVAAFDFASPRLMFTNHSWNINTTGEIPGSPISITAAIATDYPTVAAPGKTFVPVTFGNRLSVPLLGGRIVFSDPVPINFNQNEIFIVRVCVTAPLGTTWPLSWPRDNSAWITAATASRDVPGRINGQDATQVASPTGITTNQPTYGPAQIFAVPNVVGKSGIVSIGDSIADGFQDDRPGYQGALLGYEGFLTRALHGTGHGVVQLAAGGDDAAFFVQRGYVQARRLMATGCKHAVVTMGRNDLTAGTTAAVLEPLLVKMWRYLASWGLTVWQNTVPPYSTSTDNWITVGNQTTHSSNAQRILVNAWLRAGAPIDPTTKLPVAVGTGGAVVCNAYGPTGTLVVSASGSGHPLAGTFDVATALETSQDSGIWKIDFTGTGNTVANGTVTSATGTWSKGMLIAGPQIPAGIYVFSVSGSTLTLDGVPTAQTGATIVSPLTTGGIHPSPQGYYLGAAAIPTSVFT